MKKSISILLLLLLTISVFAQEKINLTFNFKCINGRSGYEYDAKLIVLQDGLPIGESPTKFQTEKNSVTVKVKKGNTTIRAILYAKVNGEWEARIKENTWSKDWDYIEQKDWIKNETIDLTFDISNEKILKNQKPIPAVSKTDQSYTNSSEFLDSKPNEKSNNDEIDDDWIDEDFDVLAKVAPKINTSSKTTTTSNYQSELNKLNNYLKTFDNGYYGYFEVKDGYIYDRFKAGKYNKFKMEDMEGAVIQEEYSRVILKCKSGNCIETDWKVNGREDYSQFLTSGTFNYKELADLFNNFRDAYLGKNNQNTTSKSGKYTESSEFLDGLKSNVEVTKSNNNTPSPSTKNNFQAALKALNDYMVTLDNGRYKGFTVEGDYLVNHYENNQSSKAKISDLGYVKENKEYKYVKLACTGDKECVYSTITERYHDYFNFNISAGKSGEKMVNLLNTFLDALKGKTTNNNSPSTPNRRDEEARKQGNHNTTSKVDESVDALAYAFGYEDEDYDALAQSASTLQKSATEASKVQNYSAALQKLNDYLKMFNAETYDRVEVKDNNVNFYFKVYSTVYNSSINISDLKQNTSVINAKSVGEFGKNEIKILCKNDKKCFYSTYSNGSADHFRFFSNSVKDLTKMEQLIRDFINAL